MNDIDFIALINGLAEKATENNYACTVTFTPAEMTISIKRKPVIA